MGRANVRPILMRDVQVTSISSRPKCKSPPVLADRDQQKS
jgi:hypothetical protein